MEGLTIKEETCLIGSWSWEVEEIGGRKVEEVEGRRGGVGWEEEKADGVGYGWKAIVII